MIFNIFCDASIDTNKKVACGGCFISCQDEFGIHDVETRVIIQQNATNNSAEILAIWVGVIEAIKLRNKYPGAIFRLFSDSKISLYGLRDWMKNWIGNMNNDGVLISSSGSPVMNQQRFIDTFNLIVENNLRIEFYHQRGHVGDRVSMDRARIQFIRANKVPPEGLGVDIEYLSRGNNYIDNATRDAVRAWLKDGTLLDYAELESVVPMEFMVRKEMLHQYIRCIDKTTVISRHDFKGGYNQ